MQARVASLTTLTSLLDLLPPEVRKGQVMPILRNHMQPLELDGAMQRCLARVFGQLVTVVSGTGGGAGRGTGGRMRRWAHLKPIVGDPAWKRS